MVTVLNDGNFMQTLKDSKLPILVDFYADWCGPCKLLAPIFEELAGKYASKAGFYKLNVDESPAAAEENGVRGIPCLVLYRGGEEVTRVVGFVDAETLRMKIDAALSR